MSRQRVIRDVIERNIRLEANVGRLVQRSRANDAEVLCAPLPLLAQADVTGTGGPVDERIERYH
eukprot:8358499-Pyramimonas_sp.AAC.1